MRPATFVRILSLASLVLSAASASAQDGPAVYGRAEALRWRVQDSPVPAPLLTFTEGSANGTFGEAGTHVLLGNKDYSFGVQPGGRFTLGGWLDSTFAVEASFFYLESASLTQWFGDPNGGSRFGLPYFNPSTQAQAVRVISGQGSSTPSQSIFIPELEQFITIPGTSLPGQSALVRFDLQTELVGADANGFAVVGQLGPFRADVLAGFRYLRLKENLLLQSSSLQTPAIPGEQFTMTDSFATTNTFFGGQAGFRAAYDDGLIYVEVLGKVAAGTMFQEVDVAGALRTNSFTPGKTGQSEIFPGGMYAQRSNIGHGSESRFAVLSEVQANAGVQFTTFFRAFVGYSFLYATSVVRPGNQIDPAINPNPSEAILFSASPTGIGTGLAAPSRTMTSSSFWAQGVSLGFELRY